ncbi:HAD family hydrolase [uncultured Tateyamaria sp.]|uniref:HAD family hydrolase n=1 Tax=uncultured Tateyamaria sp. TaxID=455651 RepID=UPI002638942B|nr:HAD family hydrolase [uncultured Tateyamaria sp.]
MDLNAGAPVLGIIFDKDGTLFDFGTTWEAWAAGFLRRAAHGDHARADRMAEAIGFDITKRRFRRDSVVIAGTPDEVATALMPHFPETSHAGVLTLLNDEAALAPQAEAVPLVPFLTGLRQRGIKLGVATNDAETPARAHLNAAEVVPFFDFIAGSDSGFGGKPEPGQLMGFCAATGLDPETVIMVGDSLHDLRAGRAAGMRTVGVLTGLADTDDLAPHATVVLSDIGGIPAWIDSLAVGSGVQTPLLP